VFQIPTYDAFMLGIGSIGAKYRIRQLGNCNSHDRTSHVSSSAHIMMSAATDAPYHVSIQDKYLNFLQLPLDVMTTIL
jgi:hypothetical protein